MTMKRQKARWQKSKDRPDIEKIVKFYVASRLHEQFFYVAIFICHIKTNTPAFQQMQLSQKLVISHHLHGQIKIAI